MGDASACCGWVDGWASWTFSRPGRHLVDSAAVMLPWRQRGCAVGWFTGSRWSWWYGVSVCMHSSPCTVTGSAGRSPCFRVQACPCWVGHTHVVKRHARQMEQPWETALTRQTASSKHCNYTQITTRMHDLNRAILTVTGLSWLCFYSGTARAPCLLLTFASIITSHGHTSRGQHGHTSRALWSWLAAHQRQAHIYQMTQTICTAYRAGKCRIEVEWCCRMPAHGSCGASDVHARQHCL